MTVDELLDRYYARKEEEAAARAKSTPPWERLPAGYEEHDERMGREVIAGKKERKERRW